MYFENAAISNKVGKRVMYKIDQKKLEKYKSFSDDKNLLIWGPQTASFSPKILENNSALPQIKDIVFEEYVDCITLDYLIDKYKIENLDILQIDAEGCDIEIIKMLKFDQIKPKIIQYEHKHFNLFERKECNALLIKEGYKICFDDVDTMAYWE